MGAIKTEWESIVKTENRASDYRSIKVRNNQCILREAQPSTTAPDSVVTRPTVFRLDDFGYLPT